MQSTLALGGKNAPELFTVDMQLAANGTAALKCTDTSASQKYILIEQKQQRKEKISSSKQIRKMSTIEQRQLNLFHCDTCRTCRWWLWKCTTTVLCSVRGFYSGKKMWKFCCFRRRRSTFVCLLSFLFSWRYRIPAIDETAKDFNLMLIVIVLSHKRILSFRPRGTIGNIFVPIRPLGWRSGDLLMG